MGNYMDASTTSAAIQKIAAVVVTYNRKAMLEKCLQSLLAQQQSSCDILVVDNASTDGTVEMLRALASPRFFFRSTGCNLGGAGGFNFGMRWAVEAGYDYVWIMDDDCFPHPDALYQLMEADRLLSGNYGFLSSAVLWTDGTCCTMNHQKVCKAYYDYLSLLNRGILQIEQATFVSLLFPAAVIRKFGLPISQYFIWGDDIEYTRRIALRGKIPSFLVGQSLVTHAMASNVGSDIATDDLSRLRRYALAYRNESFTYRQQGFFGVLLYLARCARGFFRITRYAKDHRWQRYRALFSGFFAGLAFHPKIEYLSEDYT